MNNKTAEQLKVKILGDGNYQITKKQSGLIYLLSLVKEETSLVITIKSKKPSKMYQSNYNLENLVEISKRFRGFETIEEVFQDLKYIVKSREFMLNHENENLDEIFFSYHLGKEIIVIPISSFEGIIQLNFPTMSSYACEKLSEEEKIKNIKTEVQELVKKIKEFQENYEILEKGKKSYLEYIKIILFIQENGNEQIQEIISNSKKETERRVKTATEFPSQTIIEQNNHNYSKTNDIPNMPTQFNINSKTIINIKEKYVIRKHSSYVLGICQLADGRIASCSDDATVRVFNQTTFQQEFIITGHEDGIYCISLLSDGNLLTGSVDQTIKVWKIIGKKYECLKTLKGHDGYVLKVNEISKNRICSCSDDKRLKIWEKGKSYRCIKTLFGHKDSVYSFIESTNLKYIVSVGYFGNEEDRVMRFWNNETYACDKIIENIECCWGNGLIQINDKIIVGGFEKVAVINGEEAKYERKIMLKDFNWISTLTILKNDEILCGNMNGEIFIIDIYNDKEQNPEKKKIHNDAINGFLILDDALLSCSEDNTIKIWK